MGVSRQIDTVMVCLAFSIFCQLITFSTPGWLILHSNSGLSSISRSGLEASLKYGLWYIIACVKGRFAGQYIREFHCNTMSYHQLWNQMDDAEGQENSLGIFESIVPSEMEDRVEGQKAKDNGYSAIVKWEVEVTLALVTCLVAFSLMRRQSLQHASVEMGDTTVPPSRNIYGAIFLFTLVSGVLLLIPSVAFIQVTLTFKELPLQVFKVGIPYCLVLSVFACGLNAIASITLVSLSCQKQENVSVCETQPVPGGDSGQQVLPLISMQATSQYPSNPPAKPYSYPDQQQNSTAVHVMGVHPEKPAPFTAAMYQPNDQHERYAPSDEQANSISQWPRNVQYGPQDKYSSAQQYSTGPNEHQYWRPNDYSNVQMKIPNSQSYTHSQPAMGHGYMSERAMADVQQGQQNVPEVENANKFQRELPELPDTAHAQYLPQDNHGQTEQWQHEEYDDHVDSHDGAQLLVRGGQGRDCGRIRGDFQEPPPYWKQPPPV